MKKLFLVLSLVFYSCFAFCQNTLSYGMSNGDFVPNGLAYGNSKFAMLCNHSTKENIPVFSILSPDFSTITSYSISYKKAGNDMVITNEKSSSANKTVLNKDKFYLVTHVKFSDYGSSDLLLTKINEDGKVHWSKLIGSSGRDSALYTMGTNNGVLIAGETNSGGTTANFYCFVDSSGTLKWSTKMNHSSRNARICKIGRSYYISGNVHDVGYGKDDMLLAKLNNKGVPLWSKVIGSQNGEGGHYMDFYKHDIYFGGIQTEGRKYASMIKADTTGKIIWKQKYGISSTENVNTFRVINDTILISGKTNSIGNGGVDILLLKLNGDGKILDHNAIGGSGNEIPAKSRIIQLNRNFYLTAETNSFSSSSESLIFKFGSDLNTGCEKQQGNMKVSKLDVKDKKFKMSFNSSYFNSKSVTVAVKPFAIDNKNLICGDLETGIAKTQNNINAVEYKRKGNEILVSCENEISLEVYSITGKSLFISNSYANQHCVKIDELWNGVVVLKTIDQKGLVNYRKWILVE